MEKNNEVSNPKKDRNSKKIIIIMVIIVIIVGIIIYSRINTVETMKIESEGNSFFEEETKKTYNYYESYEAEGDSFLVFNELGLHWKEINTYNEFLTYTPTFKSISELNGNIDEGFFELGKIVMIEYSEYVEEYLYPRLKIRYESDNMIGDLYVLDSESNNKNILKSKLYIITIPKKQVFTDVNIIYETQEERMKKLIPLITAEKPIIYLYPQETKELSVKLVNSDKVIYSYPKYEDEWNIIAEPDGTLTDINTQRKLYALYWEGKDALKPDMTEGFIVKGEDTIKFLEEKLEILGLNEREAQEFIIYWLPKMQDNKYNYIRFATIEEINNYMPLEFSVEPDTLIRVLMQFKPLDKYIEVKEQQLVTPIRKGFTVVEWGGSEIK